VSLDCSSVSITDTGCLERICFRLVSSRLREREEEESRRRMTPLIYLVVVYID
jgi:hypothetical protein